MPKREDYITMCTGCTYNGRGSNYCSSVRGEEENRLKNNNIETYHGSRFVIPSPEDVARCPMNICENEDPVQAMFDRLRFE